MRQSLLVVICPDQSHRQQLPRLELTGISLSSLLQRRDGRRKVLRLDVSNSQVEVGPRVIGNQSQSLLVRLDTLLELPLSHIQRTQTIQGGNRSRIELQDLAIGRSRLLP